ncbi:hypothetical protein L1987_43314 [Smallanthus sonchifolius]|uniref:Uncharacterized protein n=1 Tax=Smallanthus sonchifolius TaxID=185202 RepID=A0ACB9GLB1_9ASTR|nr:hypothetical protein L1987_43314 [Smallanthus sonchifolius]
MGLYIMGSSGGGVRTHGGKDAGGKDDGGNRPRIERIGRKFGCGRVHRSAFDILDQNLDGDWVTFSMFPHNKLREMFNNFRR